MVGWEWASSLDSGAKAPESDCWKRPLLRGFNTGLERAELEVFGSNRGAVRLYESFGFVREGRKIAARNLDGISDTG